MTKSTEIESTQGNRAEHDWLAEDVHEIDWTIVWESGRDVKKRQATQAPRYEGK